MRTMARGLTVTFMVVALLYAVGRAWAQPLGDPEPICTIPAYDRGNWRHWVDDDRDCLNTRYEVLARDSRVTPTITGCKVVAGTWLDPFSGETWTDPTKLHIDHFVPLAAAYDAGGLFWSKDRKRDYANDLDRPSHLVATLGKYNMSKGKRGPEEWVPPNPDLWCAYAQNWINVKASYDLTFTAEEVNALVGLLSGCARFNQ